MASNFELKGEWFLPLNKEKRVTGTLFFNSDDGAYLELFGNFDDNPYFPELKEEELILGLTNDSKLITLYKCFMRRTGGTTLIQGQESGKPLTIYTVNYTFVGVHIENVDNLNFNRISCEIHNLDEWVGVSGFIYNPMDRKNFENREMTVEYKLPEQIIFDIDKNCSGKFNFISNHPGWSRYQKSICINQRVEFQVDFVNDTKVEDILSYAFRFQNFIILALYRSTYITSIKLLSNHFLKKNGDWEAIKTPIELFIPISNQDHPNPKYDLEMLFDYRRIKKDFPIIVKEWYRKYETLEPAFNLLFEQFYNGNRFAVNTFLNLAQAAETFHARINNHTKFPKDYFKKMKKEILELAPKEYHDWLKDQFNFGNNLNLHARLEDLVEKYSNPILDKIIEDKSTFIKQVKHSRNYYTHYSTSGKKNALNGEELYILSEKLKALLVCAFLMESGFTNEKLTELLDNVKWPFFNHIVNWDESAS